MAPPTRAEIASTERELEDQLRRQVLSEIQRLDLAAEQIAESLGMLRPSVELLLERQSWPLDVSLRVAKALGMKVQVVAKPSSD